MDRTNSRYLSSANRPTPRRQRRLRSGFAFCQCTVHAEVRAQTCLAETGNPNQSGNRNGLSRKRQRHTRNPNADHSQNPVAPVAPPVSSGVHRRRCGARRGASGKVRAECTETGAAVLASKPVLRAWLQNTKQPMPDDEGRPRFFRGALQVRCGSLRPVSAVVGPVGARRPA